MLVFVDESGDSGRKIQNGSSKYFVVCAVTFEDHEIANNCDRRIDLLREVLRLPPTFEFHFAHNSKKIRLAFLDAVSPYQFYYHVFALNKDPEKLWGKGFNYKSSLYKYAASLTFENAKAWLENATVIIDRKC